MSAKAVLRLAVLLLAALACGCDDAERDLTDARAVFRTVVEAPVPDAVSDLTSTGQLAGAGANGYSVYLRFRTTSDYLVRLIDSRAFAAWECDDDLIRGNLTLPQGLEIDILDWQPFSGGADNRCYVTTTSYSNDWTDAAQAVMLYQPLTEHVYLNEIGR